MDLLNMFSDLAPISNNGYRQQLNTDPGILQGIEFIQNENKVKKEVEQDLELNLISDLHGTESATVHSAGVLNREDELGNIEGFTENMDTPTTKYYNDLKARYKIALDKFNALTASSKTKLLISGPIVTGIATQFNIVGTGASNSGIYYSSWCSNVPNSVCNAEYRVVFSNGVVSNMTIQSNPPDRYTNPSLLFAIKDVPLGGVKAILQGKNIASGSTDNKWYDVDVPVQQVNDSQTSIVFTNTTGNFKTTSSASSASSALATATELKCDRNDTSYCIFKDYSPQSWGCRAPLNTGQDSYSSLNTYNDTQLVGWLDALYDRNIGSDPNRSERVNVVDYVNRCKNVKGYEYLKNTKAYKASPEEELKKQLDALSTEMSNIASLMMSSVNDNTRRDFSSYNKMQKDIDNVQKRIIEVDGIMKNNSNKQIYDIDTSLAKEEETALLSKQRYYVYIIWFVILIIILYITISNLVNPESSFSVLLVTLVLLTLLFLFFMYSKWNAEWYDLKVNLKNLNFGLPDIPNLNFNPLVSIKYTS